MGSESGEHGPAMFVLFSDGAIKHGEDRNGLRDLKGGWGGIAVALLESIGEPSSGHSVNAATTIQAMADWSQSSSLECSQRRKGAGGGGAALLVNSILTTR